LHPLAESYWEEQWRNLHNNGTALLESDNKSISYKRSLKQSLGQRLGLSRTESDPSLVKVVSVNNDTENSVRRCLLNSYLHKVVQSSEVIGKIEQDKFPIVSIDKETLLSFERSSQLKIKAVNENLIVREMCLWAIYISILVIRCTTH
jgi:TBC1 domain family member 5